MRGLFTKESLTVATGQAVSGIARHAQTLRVTGGRVWITEEGTPHDYWLFAGETYAVTPGRLVVIEADAGASRVESMLTRRLSAWHKLTTPVVQAVRRLARSKNIGNSVPQCSSVAQPRQLKNCT